MARRYEYDHAWLDGLIEKEVGRQVPPPVGTIVAAGLAREIERLASDGDGQAVLVQQAIVEKGLIQLVEQHLRRARVTIPVAWNGELLAVPVPARLGHAVRVQNGSGKTERVVQYPLWLDQPWEVVAQLRSDALVRRDGADQLLTAFDKALALRTKYPEVTPREAAQLEGLDPMTFEQAI